jgi:hypothetical protein
MPAAGVRLQNRLPARDDAFAVAGIVRRDKTRFGNRLGSTSRPPPRTGPDIGRRLAWHAISDKIEKRRGALAEKALLLNGVPQFLMRRQLAVLNPVRPCR